MGQWRDAWKYRAVTVALGVAVGFAVVLLVLVLGQILDAIDTNVIR